MRSNLFLVSLATCLLGSTQAQNAACETDLTLLSSILTCIEAIPTNSLTDTANAANPSATSAACAYIKSGLGCYSSICNNVLPSEASGLLTESSLYCNGAAATVSSTGRGISTTSTTAGATTTARSGSSATGGSASQTTATNNAGASSAASANTAAASSVSSHAKAPQVQVHTMLVKEVVVVAVAGLVGGLIV